MPTLPKNIKVGLYHMKIDLFVPNPLRCLKYQWFGHSQNTCKGFDTCFRCGEEGHDGKSCQKDPICRNVEIVRVTTCHPQNNVLSEKKEKEILKVKTEKKNYLPRDKKISQHLICTETKYAILCFSFES